MPCATCLLQSQPTPQAQRPSGCSARALKPPGPTGRAAALGRSGGHTDILHPAQGGGPGSYVGGARTRDSTTHRPQFSLRSLSAKMPRGPTWGHQPRTHGPDPPPGQLVKRNPGLSSLPAVASQAVWGTDSVVHAKEFRVPGQSGSGGEWAPTQLHRMLWTPACTSGQPPTAKACPGATPGGHSHGLPGHEGYCCLLHGCGLKNFYDGFSVYWV